MDYHIGVISYTAAAVLYLLLTVLLVFNWRGRVLGFMLVAATLGTSIWAAVAAYHASVGGTGGAALFVFDLARCALWLIFLVKFLQFARSEGDNVPLGRPIIKIGLIIMLGAGVALGASYWSATDGSASNRIDLAALVNVLLAVAGLVLMENAFRNVHPDRRWHIKHLFLGLGALFVYDFFLFSDALLFHSIDEHLWAARGGVNALAVPLIAVSAARNPGWSLDLFVSRKIVFHTATLTGAGVYLLVMAAGGYYIRHVGGTWGGVVQIIFFFGAAILLLAILFSAQIRAYITVFLNKHFYNYKYDYREEWLKFTNRLSSESFGPQIREQAIRAVADIVDSTGGVLWLRREPGHYAPVGALDAPGVHVEDIPSSPAMLSVLRDKEWIVNLEAYRGENEAAKASGLPEWLLKVPRSWLIIPLLLHKELFGFMLLLQPRARRTLNWEDYDFLRLAGYQAASHLSQYESTQALLEARQFEALNKLSAFIIHDLKNLIGQLSLLVANAKKHKDNPLFVDDMIATVQNSVTKMNRLLGQLRSGRANDQHQSVIDLGNVINDVISERSSQLPAPVLANSEAGLMLKADADRLGAVFGHILQNAQEATDEKGRVEVNVRRDQNWAVVTVEDDGQGMDEAFLKERLFRPFDSTKGDAGMGIGAHESRQVVLDLGGKMYVRSAVGSGTCFEIRLPLEKSEIDR